MMEIVPIRQVKPGDNIRHALGNLGPLVKSIEAVGILEPLLVEGVDDSYTVIAGHRRLAAAKKAGLKEIPVIVMDFTEAEIAEAMLIENLQREDLSPIEEAEGLFRLETLGVTRKDMAARTGIPAKRIRERITLLDLPKQAQEKVHQRELPIEVGLLLASEPAEIVLELIERVTSARDLRWQLEAAKSRRKNAETIEELKPRLEKLEAQGIPVVVKDRGWEKPKGTGGWKELGHGWDHLDLPVRLHASQECAAYWLDPGSDNSPVRLIAACQKPKRHTFTGDSDLKIPDAEKDHGKTQARKKELAAEREAAAKRNEIYDQVESLPAETVQWMALGFASFADLSAAATRCGLPDVEAFIGWAGESKKNLRAAVTAVALALDPLKDPGWGHKARVVKAIREAIGQ